MRESGFVDLQINGNLGIDFSDPALTEDRFMTAAEHILAGGTEVFLPTIVTSPKEVYLRNLAVIRSACEKRGLLKQVPGVHLEGPFISNQPGAVGAHRPQCVIPPDCAFFDEIMRKSGNYVKLLTVAAEVPGVHLEGPFISDQPGAVGAHRPQCVIPPDCAFFDEIMQRSGNYVKLLTVAAEVQGVDALISHASAMGVAVSCGHQLAGSKDLAAAAKAGAKLLTHLGNGCPNLINRHNNMIWAGMANDDLTAMIITDGHHLPGDLIKCIVRVKGADRVIVTSDAAPIAGLPPGRYDDWGNVGILEPNGLYHNPEKGCLIGSSASMSDCVKFLRSLEILDEDGIEKVSRTNPLKMIGML